MGTARYDDSLFPFYKPGGRDCFPSCYCWCLLLWARLAATFLELELDTSGIGFRAKIWRDEETLLFAAAIVLIVIAVLGRAIVKALLGVTFCRLFPSALRNRVVGSHHADQSRSYHAGAAFTSD